MVVHWTTIRRDSRVIDVSVRLAPAWRVDAWDAETQEAVPLDASERRRLMALARADSGP